MVKPYNEAKLIRVAELSKDESELKAAMKKLREINPTYHWCPDWDFMVICDNDSEIKGCLCKGLNNT